MTKLNSSGRPAMKRRADKFKPRYKGKLVRGRACSKCRQLRPYCKCDRGTSKEQGAKRLWY